MTIKRHHWIIFLIFSVFSAVIWHYSAHPQFAFLTFEVDRTHASKIAASFLKEHYQVDPDQYLSATIFTGRREADRYMQAALGFPKQLAFLNTHEFELFFWRTRFFKENEAEQFFITTSTKTGEVTSARRVIPDTAARPEQDREDAKTSALEFLKNRFAFTPEHYHMTTDLAVTFDNRTDYTFAWTRKGLSIPWKSRKGEAQHAKLRTEITVSGDDILYFTKDKLSIPDEFSRYIRRLQTTGRNIGTVFRFVFLGLLTASVFFVLTKKNSALLQRLKRPCIAIAAFLFTMDIIFYINGLEYVIYDYPTTSSLASYFWRSLSSAVFNSLVVTVVFLMPFLAGELLHYEVFPQNRDRTLFYHIRSTFFSKNTAMLILFGYLAAAIMLGIQSVIFFIGETHLGVWTEYRWMSHSSASYFTFIPAFVIAASASLTEETLFRLFGISLGKKFLKNTLAAVLISSIIWGYGHSGYPVYPMWFRGLETSILGIFLSFIFLKFGFIPVLTAHYLFDAFWCSANFLLGKSVPHLFYSAAFILIWPAIFAAAALIRNKAEVCGPMTWQLSKHQQHNLAILKYYLSNHPAPEGKNTREWMDDIVQHGWDMAVVETAFQDLKLTE